MNNKFYWLIIAGACVWGMLAGEGKAVAQEEGGGAHHIIGIVSDPQGAPVRDVLVALGSVPTLFERERNTYTRTDETGAFSLDVTYPGVATLSCYHPDFMSVTETASTGTDAAITLRPGETLTGSVNCDTDLLGRVIVSAYFPSTGYQAYTRGDANGRFRLTNLPVGKCEIEVRAETISGAKRVTAMANTVLLPGKTSRVNVAVPKSETALTGLVTDTAGNPVAAQVFLHVETDDATYVESTRSDSDGRYLFDAVPPGNGQWVVQAGGKASMLGAITVAGAEQTLETVQLDAGSPLRCSFLNSPEGTRAIQLAVLFGKIDRPTGLLSEVRGVLDAPTAWTGVIRNKNATLDHLMPGTYTILAYPVTSASPDYSTFEAAELLQLSPVYMDSFKVNEGGAGAVVAAAFPDDKPAAHAAAKQPIHPIIGRWAYEFRGSVWTRIFTPDGRCILTEGPTTAWVNPYVILGERRVAVMIKGKKRMHEIRADGKLDVEGQFIGTKVE